ncbi:mucin-associated surface protein (MASP), putative [Trypanosoma cruzi marinkellei]|uniref:Mucin-associated surface protein (MASP), putative n=1 Tax=Trypanosoma cruzi marinkellei TaxID=85056 RepID=K2M5Y8_TRYCR|nr:mucin-associated surface protein (MASP), putative [Trypanosoma cruzi marinkellei]
MMMTCRLLCALLVLALCCCLSLCVRASELTDSSPDPTPQRELNVTDVMQKGTEKAPGLRDEAPKDEVGNDKQNNQGPLATLQEQPRDEDRVVVEVPKLNAAGPTITPGSTTPGNSVGLSYDASGPQGGTNPKEHLPVSAGTAINGQTPVSSEKISLANDNPKLPGLETHSPHNEGATGRSDAQNKRTEINTQVDENHTAQTSRQKIKMPNTTTTTTTSDAALKLSSKDDVTEQHAKHTDSSDSMNNATAGSSAETTASPISTSGSRDVQKNENEDDDDAQRPNSKETQEKLEAHNTSVASTENKTAPQTVRTVSSAQANVTATPADSDSSTAVSHTTSPLLLLFLAACTAAAAVVAA